MASAWWKQVCAEGSSQPLTGTQTDGGLLSGASLFMFHLSVCIHGCPVLLNECNYKLSRTMPREHDYWQRLWFCLRPRCSPNVPAAQQHCLNKVPPGRTVGRAARGRSSVVFISFFHCGNLAYLQTAGYATHRAT